MRSGTQLTSHTNYFAQYQSDLHPLVPLSEMCGNVEHYHGQAEAQSRSIRLFATKKSHLRVIERDLGAPCIPNGKMENA